MSRLKSFYLWPQNSSKDMEFISLIEGTSKISMRNEVPRELLKATGICEFYLIVLFMHMESFMYFLIIPMDLMLYSMTIILQVYHLICHIYELCLRSRKQMQQRQVWYRRKGKTSIRTWSLWFPLCFSLRLLLI